MRERDLIVGVLAAQAGFVTPSEVLAAAAGGLVDSSTDSLLTRLEKTGGLTAERRKTLESLADQALAARNGDGHAVLASMGEATGAIETIFSFAGTARAGTDGQARADVEIPLERPGQYTRLRELGRGSQSVVRAARDEIVGREVALKELVALAEPGKDLSSRAAQARFLREVRLVAGLDHPGIVSILELARREDGTLFCAQKLIRGETLQIRLARCRSLSDRLGLLRHVLDACQAMGFAHSRHVIHRDLKPSNIMVGEYGETVVVDWGLAKHREEPESVAPLAPSSPEPGLTVAGVALGTPSYMSPEQARGDLAAIDARSDVFSLGAILYQVLTGRLPFEGATSEHILENVRSGASHPVLTLAPEAPPELAAIAERALRTTPADRYGDAEELAKELSAYLTGGRVRAYRYGSWELLRRFVSSHRALIGGVIIAVGALLVAGVVVAVRLRQTRLELASSFRDRAYAAERDGDWSRAAAYFAAARVQHDTAEARWGLAVASERITERVLSLHGPAGAFSDVGVLPDGRVLSMGRATDRLEVRDAQSGRTLWTRALEPARGYYFLPGGQVQVLGTEGWDFHDAATGHELLKWPRSSGFPCPGVFPPRVGIVNGQLLRHEAGGAVSVLSSDVSTSTLLCEVSEDGRRVAYLGRDNGLRLTSVEDGHELVRRKFESLLSFHFSRHGLVVFKQGRLEMVGAPEGDFTIDLPESRFAQGVRFTRTSTSTGTAVSPDGELAAIASGREIIQTVVVDLRSRSIRGILHYPPGTPQLAFSLDGNRVFGAGMGNGSTLSGWRLSSEDLPKTLRWWSFGVLSRTGRTALFVDGVSGRYELFRPGGAQVASGVRALGLFPNIVGDGPAVAFITDGTDAVVLHDLEKDQVIWRKSCGACSSFSVSEDGSRLVMLGTEGLEVWDTRTDRRLFQETRRLKLGSRSTIARDGRLIAWGVADKLYIRSLEGGDERALPLESGLRALGFGPSSDLLVVVTNGSTSLLETATGRKIWSVPNQLSEGRYGPFLDWSRDARVLLVTDGWIVTEFLDAGTGERLARFEVLPRAVSPVAAELYSPDLRVKAVSSVTHWDIRPVPQPDETPATESLARILEKTGLEFRGVELVAAGARPRDTRPGQ